MNNFMADVRFEHRFWLQILGDHARFIFTTLAVTEKQEINKANMFIHAFDSLLEKSRHPLLGPELSLLNQEAYQLTCQLRAFKLHLLRRHLIGKIKIQLPPTFLNHMVNELEEYVRILSCLLQGNPVPTYHPIHHHLLWLQDAVGHAATITCSVDEVERDVQAKSKKFNKNFENLYMKAVEFAGYLRTHLEKFPALDRFNHQIELEMFVFLQFLKEIEEMSLDDQLLGTLSPLIPDHMSREECYYLTKLASVTEIKKPECSADKPRIEF
ncbi:DUF2935 domain-containing protein [Aneurinibacillus uraniidurans]|uniref:DUF2935 domain-containing protein n=1 Tax=Aneurinibacillus uraniidurans TaxID=2966586 RepID=UPI00234B0BCF|nr:DUF2935 domain-containing protein [Aneurinibacillus sp. B1]WCN38384.1 DUF2935 domain-containing protein [Aneurinibacillus sp. B1]